MRIAIVGGGISGLACARLLHERHDVHLFEASDWAGGHAHTLRVDTPSGPRDVDTGFVVYNERTYPLFSRLLAELRVATQPTEMSFSVSCARTGLEYGGGSLRGLFAQPRNLLSRDFHSLLRDALRFYREAPALLAQRDVKLSLGEWLAERRYREPFVARHLVPMGAAIWSCTPGQVLAFPVQAFARFFANHGLLQLVDRPRWRTISGGSARYVEALVAPFRERVHLREPVRRVERLDDGAELAIGGGAVERFDRVVLACHADQALSLLADPTRAERAILSRLLFEVNDVVLHDDPTLLPRARAARAAWNFHLPAEPRDAATVTYDMGQLQRLGAGVDLFVTLNRTRAIDPRRVLARFSYHHPVYDRGALDAQLERTVISGANHTHYCGAYWGYGFHEDGVRSAHEVAAEISRGG